MNLFYTKALITRGNRINLIRIRPHQIPSLIKKRKRIFVCDEREVAILAKTTIVCIAQFVLIKSLEKSIERYKKQYPKLALWMEE